MRGAELAELDAELDALPHGALSLASDRPRATRLDVLVGKVAREADHRAGLTNALATVVRAELTQFPENLFWDHDFLVAELARLDPDALRETADCIARLMRIYGVHGPIRFQFVHDFSYGFDWATYVRRTGKQGLRPFDRPFLQHSERRGLELEALARGGTDPRFPPVPEHARRNVFDFDRGVDVELRILRTLARRHQLPVEAFSIDGAFDATRDYQALRREVATGLAAGD